MAAKSSAHKNAAPAAQAPAATPAVHASAATPAAAPTKSPIGFGLNAKVGLFVPTNKLSPTVVVGIEARERFPFLRRILALGVEFAYFNPQTAGFGNTPTVGGDYRYSGSTRAFQLAADVLAFLPLSLPVDLYAGVGYAAFFYAISQTAFNVTQSESQVRHGLRVRAGVQWPFWGPLYAAGELLYHYSSFGGFLLTGPVNAGAFMFNVNLGFEI